MRGAVLVFGLVAPGLARAQGWGNVSKQEPQGFSWTRPLFDGFWMAWTPVTLALFAFVFGCVLLMGLLEWWRPGGAPRRGVLGLDTTRGDRLFISLLGSVYILLGWLGLFSTPLWGAFGLAILWSTFVFAKV